VTLALVPVWMYELGLGIAHLEFRGPNSDVWMAMEFECGNWPKFRAKSTMCYIGHAYFRAAPLRIGRNYKNLKNIKKIKNFKKLIKPKNMKISKKNKKNIKIKKFKNRKLK
jgi:hypothetical protein